MAFTVRPNSTLLVYVTITRCIAENGCCLRVSRGLGAFELLMRRIPIVCNGNSNIKLRLDRMRTYNQHYSPFTWHHFSKLNDFIVISSWSKLARTAIEIIKLKMIYLRKWFKTKAMIHVVLFDSLDTLNLLQVFFDEEKIVSIFRFSHKDCARIFWPKIKRLPINYAKFALDIVG